MHSIYKRIMLKPKDWVKLLITDNEHVKDKTPKTSNEQGVRHLKPYGKFKEVFRFTQDHP